jgi:hypothetical protein
LSGPIALDEPFVSPHKGHSVGVGGMTRVQKNTDWGECPPRVTDVGCFCQTPSPIRILPIYIILLSACLSPFRRDAGAGEPGGLLSDSDFCAILLTGIVHFHRLCYNVDIGSAEFRQDTQFVKRAQYGQSHIMQYVIVTYAYCIVKALSPFFITLNW